MSGEPAVRMWPSAELAQRAGTVVADAVAELADLLPAARVRPTTP